MAEFVSVTLFSVTLDQLLPISARLKEALLDQQDASVPWQIYFEVLVRQIQAASRRRAAMNTGTLPVDD